MPAQTVAASRGAGYWLKLIAPTLGAIGTLVIVRWVVPHFVHPPQLLRWFRGWGPWAPLIFILILTIRPLTLLPGQALTAVGGMLFGAMRGFAYSMIGSFLSTVVVFHLANRLGKRLMKRLAGDKYPALVRSARHHDFQFAALITINPLFPTDLAVAAAAASKARFWPVALGVLVGTLPGEYLTAQFGSALGRGAPILTTLSAVGMVASMVLGALLGRKMLKEIGGAQPEPPSPATSRPEEPRPEHPGPTRRHEALLFTACPPPTEI